MTKETLHKLTVVALVERGVTEGSERLKQETAFIHNGPFGSDF